MRKDLYEVIEDLDTLRLELLYQFKANKAFIGSELEDVYTDDRERLNIIDGIEYTQQGLINRLDKVSEELTEIMRAEKKISA
jgi:hypothetical protein